MRTFVTVLFALAALSPLAAQSKKPPKTISVTGCVERDDRSPDVFTLTDKKAGRTFRLTGVDLREYVGQLIRADGGIVVKGVTIKGGLQPSPNVAAQAGAMDPSRAAVAAATGAVGTGSTDDAQEFRVKSVSRGSGSCP